MNRNKFTCAARGCEGCSVCDNQDDAKRAEKLEELLTRIIEANDLGSRDDLLRAIGRAEDYLNG